VPAPIGKRVAKDMLMVPAVALLSTANAPDAEPPLKIVPVQVTLLVPVTVKQVVVPARTSAENALAVVIVNPPPAAAEAAAIAPVCIVAKALATPVPEFVPALPLY
jgi:hypothetical protein